MARWHCILLAAGYSRRFGGNKLLAPLEGKALWRWPFERLCALRARRGDVEVYVVSQYGEILSAARKEGAYALRNPAPERGLASSMQVGAAAAHAAAGDYLLFLVADQPWLSLTALERLMAALERSGKRLGALCRGGVPGNPAVFGAEYLPELMELTGDRGGKPVLLRHIEQAVLVEVPEVELRDVDTPLPEIRQNN